MNSADKLINFRKLLKLRSLFKSVNQLSWNISHFEKRYPVEALTDSEITELIKVYDEYADELRRVVVELNIETDDKKNS